jgi:hypothetical protein
MRTIVTHQPHTMTPQKKHNRTHARALSHTVCSLLAHPHLARPHLARRARVSWPTTTWTSKARRHRAAPLKPPLPLMPPRARPARPAHQPVQPHLPGRDDPDRHLRHRHNEQVP